MTGRPVGPRGRFAVIGLVALAAVTMSGCGSSVESTSRPGQLPSASSLSASTPSASSSSRLSSGSSGRVPGPARAGADVVPRADRPVRIQVPSIGIDSSLVDLGVAADGTLEVPADPARPGWLDQGPAPGQQGPAIIAGHVDSKKGPAVFYRLRELKPGEKIIVRRGDGRNVTFRVDDVQKYAKSAFPTADVYGPVPGPVLRLITCGGVFDQTVGHYRDNIVVYAS